MEDLIQSGLTITAIGMGVVFILLTLLVGIIQGMSALAIRLGGRPESTTAAAAARPAPPRDGELVAVIAAAISAYRQSHSSR